MQIHFLWEDVTQSLTSWLDSHLSSCGAQQDLFIPEVRSPRVCAVLIVGIFLGGLQNSLFAKSFTASHWKTGSSRFTVCKDWYFQSTVTSWELGGKYKLKSIWFAAYYLLVKKIFLSKLCFILLLLIHTCHYWFYDASYRNLLDMGGDKDIFSILFLISAGSLCHQNAPQNPGVSKQLTIYLTHWPWFCETRAWTKFCKIQ